MVPQRLKIKAPKRVIKNQIDCQELGPDLKTIDKTRMLKSLKGERRQRELRHAQQTEKREPPSCADATGDEALHQRRYTRRRRR